MNNKPTFKPLVEYEFSATFRLTEPEIRLLNLLCSYSTERVAEVLGKTFNKDLDSTVLARMLDRLQSETGTCIRHFNAALTGFHSPDKVL